MSDMPMSPHDLFEAHRDEAIITNINGIDTAVLRLSDNIGNYFAILATDNDLSDICGTMLLGELIKQIDYDEYNGKTAIIKAYY